jgi:hypothetical protein
MIILKNTVYISRIMRVRSLRNLLHELKLIEADLLYKISDEQKVYQLLIALFPDLSKGMINETKSKIISRN